MSSTEGSRGRSALREEMDELKGNVQELKDLMLRTLQQQQLRDPSAPQLGSDVRSMSPPRRPPVPQQRSLDPMSPHPGPAAAAPSSPPHRAVSEAVPSEGAAAAARGRSSAAHRSTHTHAEDSLSMPEDEEDTTPSRPGHTRLPDDPSARPPTSPLLHDSFSSPPHHALHGSVPPSLASVGALSPPGGASPLGLNFGAYRDVQTAQQLQRSVRSRPSTGATVSPYVGGLVAVDSEATLCNRHASPPRQPGTPLSASAALSRLPSPKEIDDHIEGILSGTVVVTATAPCPPPAMGGDALMPATGDLNSFWLRCSSNAFDLSRKNAVGFYGRRLGDVVGQSLREILLQVGCRVESIDVGCTDLTNRGVEALAQGLAAATAATVTEVKLNGNPLVGDVGLAALMAKLPPSVRTLEVGDCGLTHHAGALIAAQLPRLPLLKELYVFCNPDLGDRGAAHFASAVSGGHSFVCPSPDRRRLHTHAHTGCARSAGMQCHQQRPRLAPLRWH